MGQAPRRARINLYPGQSAVLQNARTPPARHKRTSPKRVIKGKQARLNLINGKAGNRTGKTGRKNRALARFCIIRKTRPSARSRAVSSDRPALLPVFPGLFLSPADPPQSRYHVFSFYRGQAGCPARKFTINTRPAKSFLQPARHFLAIFTFSPAYYRRQQIKTCAFSHCQRISTIWLTVCEVIGRPVAGE